MPKSHPMLQPWQPSPEAQWDAVRAGHLLNRAGFGGTPEEVAALVRLGPVRAVDALLDFPDAPAAEQKQGDGPDWSVLAEIPLTNAERRQAQFQLRGEANEQARQELNNKWQRASGEFLADATRWWLNRMAGGPHPLQERLVLFWHGHFTSSYRDDRQGSWRLWNQNELLRRHAAGNFRELVAAVSRDPAMLSYLNNNRNVKARPNENYARELMELFTLGIGNYTEDDVKQVARAFTGWGHDGVRYVFTRRQHDDGEKVVFGRRGAFGGDEVVALLMDHPACAPYVAGKVWDYFAGGDLGEDVRAELGQTLRRNGYELRPLLRVILRSKAFYAPERIGGRIKSPVNLLVGTCRLLGVPVPNVPETRRELDRMGQVVFEPPNVKGWPGHYEPRKWINTATLLARYNFAMRLVDRAPLDRAAPAEEPERFVDAWLGRLIGRPVEETKRRRLIQAAANNDPKRGRAEAVKLIVSMPEYQLC